MKKVLAVSSIVALLFSQSAISATSAALPMLVTATVLSSCVVTPTAMPFLSVTTGETAPTTSTTLVVACTTTGTAYDVKITAGAGAGATAAKRVMTGGTGTDKLIYSLYQDANHTTVWGETKGTDTKSGVSTVLPATLTVYGKIEAKQSVAAGAYTDTVMVSVEY